MDLKVALTWPLPPSSNPIPALPITLTHKLVPASRHSHLLFALLNKGSDLNPFVHSSIPNTQPLCHCSLKK